MSARWPEPESPFCAARLLVSVDNGAVNQRVFEIGLAADLFEKALENTTLGPSAKPAEHAVPVPELRWQIPPGQTGSHPPENGLQEQAIVLARHTAVALLAGKVGFKARLDTIRHHKPLLVHSNLPLGSLNQKSAGVETTNVHRP